MSWTRFFDMSSGGGSKEPHEVILIEAPEDEAKVIFYNRFGHNPERISCACCGVDYSIYEVDSPETDGGALVITAAQIEPGERIGTVPVEGWVWQ